MPKLEALDPNIVIISLGPADGVNDGSVGLYLAEYDANGRSGHGRIRWTANRADALKFEDLSQAIACWKQQSTTRPIRPDGEPNRPLTAYSISFERQNA